MKARTYHSWTLIAGYALKLRYRGQYIPQSHVYNKYFAYDSHNPAQHKRAVVTALINWASDLPSGIYGKEKEKEMVLRDLEINGYPSEFIEKLVNLLNYRQ